MIQIGKIKSVSFGLGGYENSMLGLEVSLGGSGWGCMTSEMAWDANKVKVDKYACWTESDRAKQYSKIMYFLSDLLAKAKVNNVSKLKDIPIEATFDGPNGKLTSWRILEEVL